VPSNNERRVEILRYVLDRQKAKMRTTKAEVIRHMRDISAVNTTHALIMDFIKEGKLSVEILNSQLHFLKIDEKYDLAQFERELLTQAITETHSYFEKATGQNEDLVNFIKQMINDDDLRSSVIKHYTHNIEYFKVDESGIPEYKIKKMFKVKPRKKSKSKPK
jgi:hypothetical protein